MYNILDVRLLNRYGFTYYRLSEVIKQKEDAELLASSFSFSYGTSDNSGYVNQ